MNWKIRHEGSPQALEGLTFPQVIEGLRDGLWEPTDEVMGPEEAAWTALESHPQTAEFAEEIEPPPPPQHDDETRLDMNPLIDVCLVLLVFFILTATYESIRKVLEIPDTRAEAQGRVARVSPEQVKNLMIRVKAFKQVGKTVITVEDEPVEEARLKTVLSKYVSETRKTEMLIDAQDVEWGTLVAIQDAARGAGIHKGHYLRKAK